MFSLAMPSSNARIPCIITPFLFDVYFQMNLVDWFKGMVASRRGEELVDPLIEVQPSPRALKRALLVCLRCIDLDANKRPKMGQIVHMLEADDFPFRSVGPISSQYLLLHSLL